MWELCNPAISLMLMQTCSKIWKITCEYNGNKIGKVLQIHHLNIVLHSLAIDRCYMKDKFNRANCYNLRKFIEQTGTEG